MLIKDNQIQYIAIAHFTLIQAIDGWLMWIDHDFI
jgi:hypothetical protein